MTVLLSLTFKIIALNIVELQYGITEEINWKQYFREHCEAYLSWIQAFKKAKTVSQPQTAAAKWSNKDGIISSK